MKPQIIIHLDLEGYEITKREVLDLASVLADAYPDKGKYIAAFGFLNYHITRTDDGVTVEVYEGFGYYSLYGFDINTA